MPHFYFNSHAHVERDTDSIFDWDMTIDFNSHAHVERDSVPKLTNAHDPISTHTLTWSVTNSHNGYIIYSRFQLTRSRGA